MNPVLDVARDLEDPIRPVAFGPDRSEAEAFLRALVGTADAPVTFQTFTDVEEWRDKKIDKDGKPWPEIDGKTSDPLAAWKHGTLAQHWSWLTRQNKNGAGVFVMVNAGNGRGRNEKAVREGGSLRAVFVDDDTGELTPQALEVTPTIIIRSRHGLHAYWCLRPGEPLAGFGPAQTALARKLGTDTSVNDLPRVMRLPGFLHMKALEDPFVVHVVQTNETRFAIAEVLDGFGIDARTGTLRGRASPPTAYTNGASDEALDTAALAQARHFLSGQPQAVQDDLGDKLTYRIIAHLVRDLAVPQREAMVALLEWDARNSPPWGEPALREKIANVLKYGKHELGAALPAAQQWEDPGPMFTPVQDFFASCDKRVAYIVEPYLPKKGLLIVGGPTKHGKTWFACYLAGECAAAGATVMFVEEEGPKETLRDRLQPFLRPGAKIHVAHRKGIKLDDERFLRALIEEIKAAGAQVLVLDPLNQLHKHLRQIGDVPAEAVLAVQRIIRETGCSVILVHHNRKGESWNKDFEGEGQSADLAGSYVWASSADNIIQIKAVPNKERQHGEVRFYVENSDTRNGEPFPRRLAVVKPGPRTDDSITFMEPDCPALKILRDLLPLIPDDPADAISVDNLRKAAGKGKAVVQSGVDFGVRTGAIVRRLKGGGIYRAKSVGQSESSPSRSAGQRTSDSPLIGESGVRPGLDRNGGEANAR